jgi:hypothetical protein
MEGRNKQVKFNGEIHPVADLFPMLPEDELRDLAEDIKIRGQLQPIVLDSDGRILDGRNRYQACKLAGVEPEFDTYDGDDPDGYALAVNVARRHMSKGQKAIVIAKSCILNMRSSRDAASQYGVSSQYISHAQVVLNHAPHLEPSVLSGLRSLNDAYDEAVAIKKAGQDESDRLQLLRSEAPDLADSVSDERITFDEAVAELQQRRADKKIAERVAAIDVLVADSGARTFAERVEAGEITWAEAESLAARFKTEFEEAVDRNVRRINDVAGGGWQALARMFRAPESAFNTRVAEKLTDTAQKFIKEIQADVIDLANTWEGTK